MPDICMCSGKDCPKKDSCYRHTAEPHPYRQSYFMNPPMDKETKECEHYWKVKEVKE